ncbi:ATP-binding cassette domain-containing protein [Salmonella enterica]|nr:ATP-binding cassette domain-containing protein [Salmonella enterica]EIU9581299.1 ATP-binding cassette domain-containing protein [Salmonella enterica]ELC1719784.1 ATP-binding cassette domain-containing protein [Salmonella enterica]
MTMPLLEVDSLSFSYKGNLSPVLNNLSIKIEQGGLIGLLGENGAGKTTLFNIIKGGIINYEGSIKRNFSGGELVSLPQMINLSGTLRNEEILDLICCFNKLTKKQAWAELNQKWNDDFFIRYEKIRRKRTYTVSYGEKRWLIISLMLPLCKKARLFLLDEPTVGIDIQYRMMLWDLINEITVDGKTVFFSTHIFDELTRDEIPFYMLSKKGIKRYSDMNDFMKSNNEKTPEKAFIKEVMGTGV